MIDTRPLVSERTLILAPRGRDAVVAAGILHDAKLRSEICVDLHALVAELRQGAEVAVLTEEAIRDRDIRELGAWVASQPPWSDFPFVLLTEHGGGLERNPTAARFTEFLGNVTFLERPFHPTTLISLVQSNLRSRRRQYECQRLNEELELRVQERTSELAAANRQLVGQIEERERIESTLRQMQRLEAVGQLTSGVAHDFNNLLTVVLGNIAFLEKAENLDPKFVRRLGYMRAAAERGAKLTDQLLSFSRRQWLEPKRLDLNKVILEMRDLLQSTIGGSIHIETGFGAGLWTVMADPTQLELAVLNLAINARDAMEVGGTLRVETRNIKVSAPRSPEEPNAGDYVRVSVRDTGSGMTDQVRAKVFEPFFTTKEVGKGSGLGLSQVLGFAKQSGGGIGIESRLGEGTTVHIYLPRAEAASVDADCGTEPDDVLDDFPGARILLVDDDNAVREVTRAMLHEMGYRVFEAGSGGAALDLLDREQDIDIAVIDFAMPGMNGAELARHIRVKRPTFPILFVTGFADRTALAGVAANAIVGKPFAERELARKIRLALANRAAVARAGDKITPLRRPSALS